MSTSDRIPTTEKLVTVLEEAGAPAEMIERACAGYYDTLKSEQSMAVHLLVLDAQDAGLVSIATRAFQGEFDAQDWEVEESQTPSGSETTDDSWIQSLPNFPPGWSAGRSQPVSDDVDTPLKRARIGLKDAAEAVEELQGKESKDADCWAAARVLIADALMAITKQDEVRRGTDFISRLFGE